MSKSIIRSLKTEEWYQQLLEEIKATAIETITISKEAILQGKWTIGKIIEDAVKDFNRSNIYGSKINSILATDLHWSEREIGRCRQFYKKFSAENWEEVIMKLPEGKNLSWHKVVSEYLPDGKEKDKDEKHYISVMIDDDAKKIFIKEQYKDYKIEYYS